MARFNNILFAKQSYTLFIFSFFFSGLLVSDDNLKNKNIILDNEEPEGGFFTLEDYRVVAERYGEVRDFSLASVKVLDEKEFKKQVQSTIGQSLAWEPGINSSYFGPGSSRPIIRGLGDFRVRMLLDDIGTFDVSENSPDHAISVEPLLIKRIDIHRGPDALLFGNAAIGGVINMSSYCIPEDVQKEGFYGSTEFKVNSISSGNSTASYISTSINDFSLNVTHSKRSADDYNIPGKARTQNYDTIVNPVINNPSIGLSEPIDNPRGIVPNTFIDNSSYSFGFLWSPGSKKNKLGIGHSNYESDFGIPFQYGGDANELFGNSQLNVEQSRLDLKAEFNSDSKSLKKTNIRIGSGDYRHIEKFTGIGKDNGVSYLDTIMDLDSIEGRIDFYHRLSDNFQGIGGIHFFSNELQVSRIPDLYNPIRVRNAYSTKSYNFFIMDTYSFENFTFKGGYRYSKQKIQDYSIPSYLSENIETSGSKAIGITWSDHKFGGLDKVVISLNLSHVERIPTETERYAFWSNAAINRFVIGLEYGGENIDKESSVSAELGIEAHAGKLSSRLNLYEYDFNNFIFLQDIKGIGNQSKYVAKESNFKGGEAQINFLIKENINEKFRLNFFYDFVTAKNITDKTYLPRIPPNRIGLGFDFIKGKFEANAKLRYAFSQKKVQAETDFAIPELITDNYFELDLHSQYTFSLKGTELITYAHIENLLDDEQRMHSSFIKDVAPLPGRNLSIGMRWNF